MTILVCGEALFDVFPGEAHAQGVALDARIGGSAFNLAGGLAALGRPAALHTGIGAGRLGERLMQGLRDRGVSTDHIRRKDAPVTLAMVEVGADGGARYVFHGEGAADRLIAEADLPGLEGVSALAFGCFSLLTRPTGDSFLALAARAGREGGEGPLVSLDPNIRTSIEPDMDHWRARVDAFASHAHLIKISAEDIEALHPGLAPEDAAARWLDMGARLVVLTRGGEGAVGWSRKAHAARPARKVEVADTVGAGDSFHAGLLTALAEGGDLSPAGLEALDAPRLSRALDFAIAASGLTCARRGADMPLRKDLPPLPSLPTEPA